MLCALDGGKMKVLMLCTYVRSQIYHFILFYLILFHFIHETSCKHRFYCAEVIYVTFYLLVLSSGMENRT